MMSYRAKTEAVFRDGSEMVRLFCIILKLKASYLMTLQALVAFTIRFICHLIVFFTLIGSGFSHSRRS